MKLVGWLVGYLGISLLVGKVDGCGPDDLSFIPVRAACSGIA